MDSRKSKLYSNAFSRFSKSGPYGFGPLTSDKMRMDPQYVMFQQARYKHAARILSSKRSVMDIGAGDGVGLPILCSYFDKVIAVDIDQTLLEFAEQYADKKFKCEFLQHDFFENQTHQKVGCAVCFDVLSLVPKAKERTWIKNISKSLDCEGMLAVGTQNRNLTQFGDPKNHIDQPNFKNFEELQDLIMSAFRNVIMLSMNDETLHTGKRETCQYFVAIGVGPK